MKNFLKSQVFQFSNQNEDGRINSCFDENKIIELLVENFGGKIKKPKIRMWYDFLVFDYLYGWLPVNIKTTTTKTSDNTGNLAMCVYAYTNYFLDLDKPYTNGNMSNLFFDELKNKKYNKYNKKDYYFLVLNKELFRKSSTKTKQNQQLKPCFCRTFSKKFFVGIKIQNSSMRI